MMGQTADRSGAAGTVGPLDVRLAVEVDDAVGCPLRGRDLDGVRQSVTRSAVGDPETCQVVVEDDESPDYRRTAVGDGCACAVFEDHDCIADLEAIRDGRLVFSVVVPDRDALRSVVEDLRATGATVSLERIRTGGPDGEASPDGVTLTDKQREALALAIEAGYYDRPREATLDELADGLGVTRSAVSQRLTAVERKLVAERAREADLG